MQKIRPLYEALGAEGYYQAHGDAYENPHFPEIKALLERNLDKIDLSSALDFAAGGGEVTQVLQEHGIKTVCGCDPYTHALYARKTGLPCLQFSFKDVIRNGLQDSYSVIISSFALHLCPEKELFPLVWNLLEAAPLLVIITPHKRPPIENLPGIELVWEDFVCTSRGKKVRMKAFRRLP